MDKRYQKSSQQAFNTATQPYVATGTALNILGTQCTDSGCSVVTQAGGMQIRDSGIYYISASVTSTATATGTQTVQFYKDGVALPCAITSTTPTVGSVITQNVETTLEIPACCAINPTITLMISGATGSVSYVRMTITRQA